MVGAHKVRRLTPTEVRAMQAAADGQSQKPIRLEAEQ